MLGVTHNLDDYLERFAHEIRCLNAHKIELLADLIYEAWQSGHFIYVFGNGGSGATAAHFAEDLGKNALAPADVHDATKRRVRVLSLADNTSWITALANDLALDQIFVQQLMQYAVPGDLVIALSGSGNSRNVLAAVEWANEHGLRTFGLTGFDGGQLREIQEDGIQVALADQGMAESIHLTLLHWVVEEIHARINQVGRYQRNSQEELRDGAGS